MLFVGLSFLGLFLYYTYSSQENKTAPNKLKGMYYTTMVDVPLSYMTFDFKEKGEIKTKFWGLAFFVIALADGASEGSHLNYEFRNDSTLAITNIKEDKGELVSQKKLEWRLSEIAENYNSFIVDNEGKKIKLTRLSFAFFDDLFKQTKE